MVVTAVVGLATTASAVSLTVTTTDIADIAQTTFAIGDTIRLKVTGDATGGTGFGAAVNLVWNGSIVDTIVTPIGCNGSAAKPCTSAAQGNWFQAKFSMGIGDGTLPDGSAWLINQANPRTAVNIDTSFVTLIATAMGVSQVRYGGSLLDFFGIYAYPSSGPLNIPTGHSFTIVPEPATAVLIGLSLLGLAGLRRVRTYQLHSRPR